MWLYFRFPLRFREVEGSDARARCSRLPRDRPALLTKFGQVYANGLRRWRPRPGDKWHLDEVFVKINGELKYLWRAVDADGNVLDILVQSRRDKAAARRFFRRLLKTTRTVPRVIVTDKLRSYGAAHREVMPSVEHRSHKGLNNRAENGHQPTRQRERAMKGFPQYRWGPTVPGRVQRHLTHFRPRRHLMTAPGYRTEMTIRFTIWDQVTGVAGLPATA
ncbi:IS6 family transposase [Streptomyces hirsutus]